MSVRTRAMLITLARWSLPLASVAMVAALRVALRDALEGVPPFLLFLAAVMTSASLGGLGPGLLATVLAAAAINFFLIAPFNTFIIPTGGKLIEIFMFCAEGVFISIFSSLLHSSVKRARASEHQAKQLERRIIEVADAERQRIGHDLHDVLGQQLLGAAFMGKTLQTRLQQEQSPHITCAKDMTEAVNLSLSYTRDMARSLSSFIISRDDFPAALTDLAVSTEKMFSVRCIVQHDPALSLPGGQVAEHLFRIAQEAINNAVKHGKALKIDIYWEPRQGGQVLLVRDDGVGFDLEEVRQAATPGIGLHVMQYRAELIGGSLTIESRAGGGTLVSAFLPGDRIAKMT